MAATQRSSSWSLTINNPTDADEECINVARQKGWKVEGQLEKGENGTPHYQLLLSTGQVRFAAVKKVFPRAHIEPARNFKALQQYVHKEDTREAELADQSELYPSLSKFWDLIFEYFNCREKYGLDQEELSNGNIILYDRRNITDPRVRLNMLDEAASHLIKLGYHVESIAVNPSTRSSFSRYMESIFLRSYQQFKHNEQHDSHNLEDGISQEETIQQAEVRTQTSSSRSRSSSPSSSRSS